MDKKNKFWKKMTTWYKDQTRTPYGEALREDHISDKTEDSSREYFSPEVQRGYTGGTPDSSYTDSGYHFDEDYPLAHAFPRKYFDYEATEHIEGDY